MKNIKCKTFVWWVRCCVYRVEHLIRQYISIIKEPEPWFDNVLDTTEYCPPYSDNVLDTVLYDNVLDTVYLWSDTTGYCPPMSDNVPDTT